jgi:hypothetical protein
MMITHVVFFKLKERTLEAIQATAQVLSNMEGKIPVLKHIEVGKDVLHMERSYDIVLITKFNSLDDLKVYDEHPLHLEVKAHMKQVLDGTSVCVDFES